MEYIKRWKQKFAWIPYLAPFQIMVFCILKKCFKKSLTEMKFAFSYQHFPYVAEAEIFTIYKHTDSLLIKSIALWIIWDTESVAVFIWEI